ncbi:MULTISPECIES: tRNA1(Val) (adenine(37)-N6)-methyltransferase [Campylobacter]|uniref:Methyltransferase n=1 Tax=Campylobacter porcelli TaxID=1660073 RepID=A0A1X9SX34_9BACT|nr:MULTISPECIES: methyltransferase [unclassified Campylobacter]MCR8678269.1 methyltransferase [Campylobacter sp. RM19072]MCR8695620.1 methyltransferase [Campylobacter sp. RM19073]MEE3704379.1 methyltransferase [Campylobacter sp. CX2-8023-23]MEE3744026.1 methyltransferase [Campylobacter sp. CX2-4855-23]MEE3776283.1 methyltransferase [Campylobacter sp. CX2-4080-23]
MDQLELYQLKDGYRYNSDTLFLYDFIGNKLKGEILDVGCGCGILGFLVARDNKISLSGIDIEPLNIEISRHNSRINGIKANFIVGDFAEFRSEVKFDFIISNPPFYHANVIKSQNSHIARSRYSNSLNLEQFLASCNRNLKPKGVLYFCYDAKQIREIFALFDKFKMNATKLKFIHSKHNQSAKLVLIESKKSSRSMCEVVPPLVVFDKDEFSIGAKEIFKKANTISKVYE